MAVLSSLVLIRTLVSEKLPGNMRNGHSQKTLKGEQGHVDSRCLAIGRARLSPSSSKRGKRALEGFDDKILALYARGMTTRDIQA